MIEATGLTKHYGDTVAVDGLSFTVHPGRVTGFLGPNGAGKSTTMRMMLGLDAPTSGHVHFDGKPYTQLKRPLSTVGALLEAGARHPGRSARNHLRWIAALNRIPEHRVDEVLRFVGLDSVADKKAGTFSLGMLQRLGIATALLGDPRVLLLDEPANGLDPEGIQWMRQLMHTLADQGRTILVSSHLLSEMSQTAQDIVVIGKGRLIYQGDCAEFIAQATGQTVRVRSPHLPVLRDALRTRHAGFTESDGALTISDMDVDTVGELAFEAGATLYELSPQQGSLEQAFIELTGDSVEYQTPEAHT